MEAYGLLNSPPCLKSEVDSLGDLITVLNQLSFI